MRFQPRHSPVTAPQPPSWSIAHLPSHLSQLSIPALSSNPEPTQHLASTHHPPSSVPYPSPPSHTPPPSGPLHRVRRRTIDCQAKEVHDVARVPRP